MILNSWRWWWIWLMSRNCRITRPNSKGLFCFFITAITDFNWNIHLSCKNHQFAQSNLSKDPFQPRWVDNEMRQTHLKASQRDREGDVQRAVHHSSHRLDEGHEEQREPHNADKQHHDHASHSVLHHFLLLLASRLRVPLCTNHIQKSKSLIKKTNKTTTPTRKILIISFSKIPSQILSSIWEWRCGRRCPPHRSSWTATARCLSRPSPSQLAVRWGRAPGGNCGQHPKIQPSGSHKALILIRFVTVVLCQSPLKKIKQVILLCKCWILLRKCKAMNRKVTELLKID